MVSIRETGSPNGGQEPLLKTNLPLELFNRGKVRDTYRLPRLEFPSALVPLYYGDYSDSMDPIPERFLMVATDRVSAFDVVLPAGIPDKGRVLNLMSAFWFEKTRHLSSNHLVRVVKNPTDLGAYGQFPDYVSQRSMTVRPAERIDVECVVRGYLSGSAWVEYSQYGTIHGQPAPSGLRESDKLPEPIFTPTTKADIGHDKPISLNGLANMVGSDLAQKLEKKSIAVYQSAADYARSRGIIIADTKMEFGFIDGQLCLIDELLTPDSSRFWDVETYSSGGPQPSFDKQYLRDWLTVSGWNKEPPAPSIPDDVVQRTAEKYREAYRRLTGKTL